MRTESGSGETVHDIDVLHVTECFEGGVSRAIASLVDASPHLRHGLLATGADFSDPDYTDRFVLVRSLGRGLVGRTARVRQEVRRLQPAHVHAHSSWAGVYVRAGVGPGPHLIYQPHGFAFEKRHPLLKTAFFFAEVVLAQRQQTIVVLSPRERRLARLLALRPEIAYLPNIATVPVRSPRPSRPPYASPGKAIGMVGRLSEQKDPHFFVETVLRLRALEPNIDAFWIGDGDQSYRQLMEHNSIEVTGWLKGSDLVGRLDALGLYVHTAVYEGFPLSVLDAASRDRGIIVRDIAAFEGTTLLATTSPDEMAREAHRYFADDSFAADVRRRGERLLEEMNPASLQVAANALYQRGAQKVDAR